MGRRVTRVCGMGVVCVQSFDWCTSIIVGVGLSKLACFISRGQMCRLWQPCWKFVPTVSLFFLMCAASCMRCDTHALGRVEIACRWEVVNASG